MLNCCGRLQTASMQYRVAFVAYTPTKLLLLSRVGCFATGQCVHLVPFSIEERQRRRIFRCALSACASATQTTLPLART